MNKIKSVDSESVQVTGSQLSVGSWGLAVLGYQTHNSQLKTHNWKLPTETANWFRVNKNKRSD